MRGLSALSPSFLVALAIACAAPVDVTAQRGETARSVFSIEAPADPLIVADTVQVRLTINVPQEQVVIVRVEGREEIVGVLTPFGRQSASVYTVQVPDEAVSGGLLRLALESQAQADSQSAAITPPHVVAAEIVAR